MKKLIRLIKDLIKDNLEDFKRLFPRNLKEDKNNNLSHNQIYPSGKNLIEILNSNAKENLKDLNISKKSKIASLGTCFAEEIASHFKNQENKLEYINLEKNIFNFSANWGRVYTIKNLFQIVSYSIDKIEMPIYVEKHKDIFFDPLREYSIGSFNSEKEAIINIKNHRKSSRDVFEKTDVLIITVGQNEFWYDSQKDIAWGRTPPKSFRKNSNRFKAFEYSFIQNSNDLDVIIKKLKEFNPRLKIILTVSPVPEYATFLNRNIVSQAFAGKCILRAVLHEIIAKHEGVFYFPSFEYVLTDNPNSYIDDNMHIKRFKVAQILKSLENAIL
jgi:hypothetical protein